MGASWLNSYISVFNFKTLKTSEHMNPPPKKLPRLAVSEVFLCPHVRLCISGTAVVFFYKPWVIFSRRKKFDFFKNIFWKSSYEKIQQTVLVSYFFSEKRFFHESKAKVAACSLLSKTSKNSSNGPKLEKWFKKNEGALNSRTQFMTL